MLTKLMNWTKKPITWGGYLKFSGICAAISVVTTALTWVYIFRDEVAEFVHNFAAKLNPRNYIMGLHFEDEEES